MVLLGADVGAAIEDVQIVEDRGERWLPISQFTVAEGGLALARVPVDGLVSGSVAALADGGIRAYLPGASEQGRLALFPGEPLSPAGDVDFGDLHLTTEGADLGDSFGCRVVSAGDLDGDGRADLAVAAPGLCAGPPRS